MPQHNASAAKFLIPEEGNRHGLSGLYPDKQKSSPQPYAHTEYYNYMLQAYKHNFRPFFGGPEVKG